MFINLSRFALPFFCLPLLEAGNDITAMCDVKAVPHAKYLFLCSAAGPPVLWDSHRVRLSLDHECVPSTSHTFGFHVNFPFHLVISKNDVCFLLCSFPDSPRTVYGAVIRDEREEQKEKNASNGQPFWIVETTAECWFPSFRGFTDSYLVKMSDGNW